MKILTTDEVAEILNITQRTVYNYIKTGELKAHKMGKYWRIFPEDLRAFILSKPTNR